LSVASIEQALLGRLQSMGLQDVLRQTPDGWELLSPDEDERPVLLDLEKEFQQWKRTLTSFRDQPLYRALGVKGAELPYVLDATCGLAGDSLQLLAYGCRVHSWERHPVPGLMLLRAYEAWQHVVKLKWTLELETFAIPEEVSIIYFDPMYSEVSKKALPRKEMRIFREVVGQDTDAIEVAERLRAQKIRLIIKRPPKSSELLPGVAFAQEGKAVRFDVYLP
jgi:16S rRNA (guanine1516-N2)-methyltransferase